MADEPIYDVYAGFISSQLLDYDIRLPGGYAPVLTRFNLHGVNANFAVSSSTFIMHQSQAAGSDPPPFAVDAKQDIPGCSYVEVDLPDGGGSDLCIDIVLVLKPTNMFTATLRIS
jgi:hypothetical protein